MQYSTPNEDSGWKIWVFIGALFVVWIGFVLTAEAAEPPAPSGPDYVTSFGISVYDPFHHSFAEEVDTWALLTLLKAPDEDKAALIEFYATMTLVIHEGPRIVDDVYPCGKPGEGYSLLGCTDPFSRTINIAWRGCSSAPMSSGGIFAHEMGHLADFYVRGIVGHQNPEWFGPDQAEMARRVSGPLCRMSK